MSKATSAEIREKYLKPSRARAANAHVPSSLIPDDPSLLLISAAAVSPLLPALVKELDPRIHRHHYGAERAHQNDIDNIGDARHPSLEMLGNFSPLHYKRCSERLEFSTEVLGLPKDELYFTTVFRGLMICL